DKKIDLVEAFQVRAHFERQNRNFDAALSDLDNALALKPDDAIGYARRSDIRALKKDLDGALADLDQAERFGLESGYVHHAKAAIKEEKKDYTGAIQEYQETLRDDPDSSADAINLMWLFVQINDVAKATDHLDQFLSSYIQRHKGKLPRLTGEKVIKNSSP